MWVSIIRTETIIYTEKLPLMVHLPYPFLLGAFYFYGKLMARDSRLWRTPTANVGKALDEHHRCLGVLGSL
jgi:hypothetical protein